MKNEKGLRGLGVVRSQEKPTTSYQKEVEAVVILVAIVERLMDSFPPFTVPEQYRASVPLPNATAAL